jgi:hypothetical protein
VTLHGYDAYPPQSEPESEASENLTKNLQLGAKIARMRSTFQAAGTAANRPEWLTEIGWPTWGQVDEGKQARWLIRSIVLSGLNGADLVYLYTLYDGDNPKSPPPENHFGLLRLDHSPKQAYQAVQNFISKLGNYRIVSRLPVQDPKNSVYIVQLTDPAGRSAYVVWDSIESGTGFFRRAACAVRNGL